MKKLNKVFAAVFVVVLVLSMLSGCTSKDATEEGQNTNEMKNEPVTLSVTHNWFGSDAHSAWTAWAFEDFQKKYPHITLEINEVPSDKYRAKVRADFMADSATDVVLWYSGAELADYVKQELVLDLTDVMAPIADNFMDGTLNNMTIDGKNFGLPLCQNFFALYVNKEIYEEYNLDYPETYEQLLEQCELLSGEGIIPIMLPGQNHPAIAMHFYSFIANMTTGVNDFEKASYGEDGASYNDEGFVKAAEILAELQTAGAFDPNIDGINMASVEDMFLNGEGAMYFIGIWRMGALPMDFKEKLHPISFPVVEGYSDSPSIATGQTEMGWIINDNVSEDPAKMEAIKLWVEYFGSKEVGQKHTELTDTAIPLQKGVDLSTASNAVKESQTIVQNSESRPFLRYFQSPAQGGANNELAWNLINGRSTVEEEIAKFAAIPFNQK